MSEKLLEIVPESSRQPYDMYEVIREIVDDGEWFDLKPKFAKTLITCFARFGGQPVGIVANQPKQLAGILDNDSADKAARFINLCDAFQIPLVFLQDVPGFMVGAKVEHAGIIRHGAKMLYAVSRATVPKVTVIVRKAYGAGYYVMCGKAYEPDLIVAWPGAEISVMGAEGAVNIIGRSAIEASEDPDATREAMLNAVREQIDPYIAAGNAVIDDIIDPRETRPTIVRALRMARTKHVTSPQRNARGDARMSSFGDPVVISCSISGVIANRDQCPAIPYTPEEYAAEARRAVDEGASQIHIHARKPDGTPSYEVEDFKAITEAILAEVGDVIVNYSTGAIGIPIEKRIEYLRECRPDVAALNMSSMNYAKYSSRRKDFVFKAVFENSFDTIIEFLTAMRELGIKPEHECFDAGHVANLDPLIDMGLLDRTPLQVSLVMGVNGGIRPTPRNVGFMADQVPGGAGGENQWQVIGISRDQWKLLGAALVLGGNVRAGVEDNLYLPNGEMAKSNGELIAKARQMAEDVGRRAGDASPRRASCWGSRSVTALPLSDVRVLDLTRLLPGGFCSLLLADLGAEVLKVEDTGMGDYIRWAPPYYGEESQQELGTRSSLYLALNRGKRSVRLDLKSDAGREALLRLVAATTSCSTASAPACSTSSGSATSACGRRTPRLSSARSPATARTAPTRSAPATT